MFTRSFGRLRVLCRNSASPVTSFVAGNVLLGSVQLQPLKPRFEKLTVEFADEEYQFVRNTVDFCDQDYAAQNNRIQNPLASQFGLVGCSTKSQAARIAVVRTREELCGVGLAEQTKARMVAWKTTILALDTEAGQPVSLADPDVPDGLANFRITSWRLNRDWSVDIQGKTVTASMYDLTSGAKPAATSEVAPPAAGVISKDTGLPPVPYFRVQQDPIDPCSLEVYGLTFPQPPARSRLGRVQSNTRTITTATFGITMNDGGFKVATANFPPDYFYAWTGYLNWSIKVYLPGKTVTQVTGYVTNAFGDSDVYTWVSGAGDSGAIVLANSAIITPTGSGSGGSFVAGNAAVFSDTTGKLGDSGAPPVLFAGGAKTQGKTLIFDANGKAVANTADYIPDAGGAKTSGHAVVFDANGKLADAGAAPVLAAGNQPYDIGFYLPGMPGNGVVICKVDFPRAVAFAANFAGSRGAAPDTNSTGDTVFTVKKNGLTIGTITVASTGAYTFATSGGAAQSFAAGDVMIIVAPSPPDATLQGIGWTLVATR